MSCNFSEIYTIIMPPVLTKDLSVTLNDLQNPRFIRGDSLILMSSNCSSGKSLDMFEVLKRVQRRAKSW